MAQGGHGQGQVHPQLGRQGIAQHQRRLEAGMTGAGYRGHDALRKFMTKRSPGYFQWSAQPQSNPFTDF